MRQRKTRASETSTSAAPAMTRTSAIWRDTPAVSHRTAGLWPAALASHDEGVIIGPGRPGSSSRSAEEESFRRLVDDAVRHPPRGWDFSFLSGRVVTQPLPWDYVELARQAVRRSGRVLDVDTGGGEVLAAIAPPSGSIAVEPYLPNVPVATETLTPYGVEVRIRQRSLPVEDGEVDLVLNRHGAFDAQEAFRVLRPGGRFVSQQVGSRNDVEINEALGAPLQDGDALVSAAAMTEVANAAGFDVERCEEAWPTTDYLDVGALVLQLRTVSWQVPGFDAEMHRADLERIHRHVVEHGSFRVTNHRLLLVARRR